MFSTLQKCGPLNNEGKLNSYSFIPSTEIYWMPPAPGLCTSCQSAAGSKGDMLSALLLVIWKVKKHGSTPCLLTRKRGKWLARVYIARCEEPGMKYGFLSLAVQISLHPTSHLCIQKELGGINSGQVLWCLLPSLFLDLALGRVVKWTRPTVSTGSWPLLSGTFILLKCPNLLSGTQRPHNIFSWLGKPDFHEETGISQSYPNVGELRHCVPFSRRS